MKHLHLAALLYALAVAALYVLLRPTRKDLETTTMESFPRSEPLADSKLLAAGNHYEKALFLVPLAMLLVMVALSGVTGVLFTRLQIFLLTSPETVEVIPAQDDSGFAMLLFALPAAMLSLGGMMAVLSRLPFGYGEYLNLSLFVTDANRPKQLNPEQQRAWAENLYRTCDVPRFTRETIRGFLIAAWACLVVMGPFILLGLDNYTLIKKDGIVVAPYWSLAEEFHPWSDFGSAEISLAGSPQHGRKIALLFELTDLKGAHGFTYVLASKQAPVERIRALLDLAARNGMPILAKSDPRLLSAFEAAHRPAYVLEIRKLFEHATSLMPGARK